MPELSIVIPTYKRSKILRKCLEHLEAQTVADQIEVIVVSDGHDFMAEDVVKKNDWKIPVKYFEVKKSQQGVARNKGVKEASSPITLFIGDDSFLQPDACEKHLIAHNLNPNSAVLGFTTWDPDLEVTPVMKWLEKGGWQFGYPMIEKYAHKFLPEPIQHRFTYTIHLSLPTKAAKLHPFREDVTMYGWEDTEFGMRLRKSGIRLMYEPDAKAFHHHPITLEESLKRMETLGVSVMKFAKTIPNFDRVPRGLKRIAYNLMAMMPTMAGKHRKAFLRGMKRERNSK